MDQLQGKVAVVTGAASGIGRALAERFGAEGMNVVLADIDGDGLDVAVQSLLEGGVAVVGHVTDVSDGDDIEDLAAATLDTFGAVHVLCNNAGIGGGGVVAGFDVESWRRVIEVDLWSVLHGMRVFLPILMEQGEGHVVNTASVAGLFAPPFTGPYAVSKFGVVAISESAFRELEMFAPGVGISVLCPGWVKTNIAGALSTGDAADNPMAQMMSDALRQYIDTGMAPSEVADKVVDAIRARRFYILTHDTSHVLVRKRMEAIVEGGDPPTIAMENF
jgi:NAD(P)-dependent dehydrogenase (short-subunit alcohol dehydrogenase family)